EAFEWCGSLKEITIPNSVISIDEDVFLDCSDMTIYYSGDTLDAYIDSYSSDWEANNIVWVKQ
ncbi:MAG: leucine-rich repeat domain-containing protein, partial [Lachnospiraceae bacterium]|nr:leucine-rich repeat domain-containing protein [Lachnospiraceae bacterium]